MEKKIVNVTVKKHNKKRRKKRRRLNKRQRVVMLQIAAISILFFVLTLGGAALLTDMYASDAEQEADGPSGKEEDVVADLGSKDEDNEGEGQGEEEEVEEVPVELLISMAGDCTIGTDIHFSTTKNFTAYYNRVQDYGYFFKNVREIFEGDDLTIVNMEGTLTDSDNRQDKTFAFKGDPEYAQILTLGGVDAANLANNHSKDYGIESYHDTIEHLENAGVTTFGYDRVAVVDVKGIKVGLVGIYELADGMNCQTQLIENIELVENMGAQLIIVSFHWGSEKAYYPDSVQVELGHIAVDHGADLVVGHHPHVLQGIEEYKGKNIVYSLGNFCFGGNSNPSDKNTMIFQQTFTFEKGVLVEDNKMNIIPCCVSSVWTHNDYCPTPLEGEEAIKVLQKIEEYSAGLSE